MERASGVLMHISSLYGDFSCGSFGKEAKDFIDFLEKCGFKYWQVLPFCMTDECNSPYKSFSSFGGNPFFIDLQNLADLGLITNDELQSAKQKTPYSCEFDRLNSERLNLLLSASKRCNNRMEIESFVRNNKYLKECCEFMALKSANGNSSWNEWTTDNFDNDILFLWQFIQFHFFKQWDEIKSYANNKNIKIIGDIPIYVSYDSSDVWANKDLFQLDENFVPSAVAGVPPDYFCEDGQMWGNPLYDWGKMKLDGYSWWCDRINHMLNMFDGVRIDHFRGLESYWSIPYNAKTAKEGTWVKGPGKDFIDKLNKFKTKGLIIAEDLGDITAEVSDLVDYSQFPGMRVFQFGFLNFDNNTHLPHNYTNNCIAYTGTHDNNTLLGYVWEMNSENRKYMLDYCGFKDENWDNCYDSIISTIFRSNAGIVILPIQDLLRYGADTRLNTPGKANGNWSYRITRQQILTINTDSIFHFNEIFKR